MNNLKTFDNLYASLAQSAYEDRPYSFYKRLKNADEFSEMIYSENYVDGENGLI